MLNFAHKFTVIATDNYLFFISNHEKLEHLEFSCLMSFIWKIISAL